MPASRLRRLSANVVICWRNCSGFISADNKYFILQKEPQRACRALMMKAADVKSGGSELKLLKYSGNLRGLPGILAIRKNVKKKFSAIQFKVCWPPAAAVLEVKSCLNVVIVM